MGRYLCQECKLYVQKPAIWADSCARKSAPTLKLYHIWNKRQQNILLRKNLFRFPCMKLVIKLGLHPNPYNYKFILPSSSFCIYQSTVFTHQRFLSLWFSTLALTYIPYNWEECKGNYFCCNREAHECRLKGIQNFFVPHGFLCGCRALENKFSWFLLFESLFLVWMSLFRSLSFKKDINIFFKLPWGGDITCYYTVHFAIRKDSLQLLVRLSFTFAATLALMILLPRQTTLKSNLYSWGIPLSFECLPYLTSVKQTRINIFKLNSAAEKDKQKAKM